VRDDRTYWLARQRELEEIQAVGYRSKSAAFNEWIYRVRERTTRRIIGWVLEQQPGRVRVLDAGAGAGFYVALWEERAELEELVGLDVSPEAVQRLRARFPYRQFEVVELGSGDWGAVSGDFDVVECFDVLYHITDDARFESALGELAARVRPGGFLLLTDNFPRRDVTTRPHVRLRSEASYRRALTDFERVRSESQFLLLNVPSGIVRSGLRWPLVLLWEAVTWPARWNAPGWALGGLLAGADRLLLPLVRGRTPSTKLVVYRRRPAA
jgi:SAM-dependent methyltransferase